MLMSLTVRSTGRATTETLIVPFTEPPLELTVTVPVWVRPPCRVLVSTVTTMESVSVVAVP